RSMNVAHAHMHRVRWIHELSPRMLVSSPPNGGVRRGGQHDRQTIESAADAASAGAALPAPPAPSCRPVRAGGLLMEPLAVALTWAAAVGSALVAGVFFAFSSFVMPALATLPAAPAIRAMQAINRAA